MDIYSLLRQLNDNKASDLLLASRNFPSLRINNELAKIGDAVLSVSDVESLVAPIISKEDMEEFKNCKELDTSYEDERSRYRINLHYQMGGMGATIRLVPKQIPTLEALSLPPIVKTFTKLERGLVLVTGPTGCGKSTTQASMIDQINSTRPCHIVTIEDPIEFVHTPRQAIIEQREVGLDTNSFSEALKRVLRQAPDVILVGEMRDLESIQMAITAAETGHFVISTLHTQDAVQSIDRIIDVFPPHQQTQIRTQLSLTLHGIISQQLIPRADKKGLVGAYEILRATSGIRNIIRKGSTQEIYSMMEIGSQNGMQTMDASLLGQVKNNLITGEQALTYAINRDRMEKLLSGAP
ncbi:type IV pili twitching motility protein PilT [candidate division WOR-1 bacterium RIFOXYA12_FULL_52_29]|uniref:Type IV pili twitching motility protein PilT n=1 Tax=candidate division WOR-1 bacterium RIFOXYC12_FULL_54_18 TaxID=1802584 RepID=A0A1F4T7J5_UNCSA|nr:MAG: type IV pili twitching motility protein PilT [candidate division WOR-1 bacterium RIFOXYA2_FULL_51_19]OGC18189.1 MAG: type IV pili twitching motility protein PilT [candidate division WOR-1 bacterium RIFOXYA12_FULL_52_29]OGC27044.1 MAG: type IV pili twitching motility protein PilT [candidate division WOR-1 bacterium RIFOXYB2_FULL_45_9]OGC28606.1 MAG: type IV pili twitching motility protein PilT [candidate division WOR-1 bacterium RIFOXYC12_FULL_54_18]OGC30939.1 MAG: type IV pili twitching